MSSSFINNFEIIDTFQLLMGIGDVALISLNFKGWVLKLNVTFSQDNTDTSSIKVNSTSYAPEFDFPVINFINWDKLLFGGMNKDQKQLLIGTHDNGKKLYLRTFVFHSDEYYHLTLQFLAEPTNNKDDVKGE